MEATVVQAIQIEAFGNPAEVMKVVDIPDVGAPGEGEVVIALEASPINMSDLLMISGRYGHRPKLPSVMGTEGVGRVVAVGAGVKHLKQGDRTLVQLAEQFDVHPNQISTWKDQLLEGAAEVFATSSSARPSTPKVDIKVLHAKIGELTLENDFLESALDKAGLLSARR